MANYSDDRAFTDFVHHQLALPLIYKPLKWEQLTLDTEKAKQLDLQKGIDYVFTHNGRRYTVQERFRESKYSHYTDFTIRYRRDFNAYPDRKLSEYYKLNAEYFTYGIVNGNKAERETCTQFLKFAIINLNYIYEKIDAGLIYIRDNNLNTCKIKENKLECPIKWNKDQSSSFFPVDIGLLVKLWGTEMLLTQKGFI